MPPIRRSVTKKASDQKTLNRLSMKVPIMDLISPKILDMIREENERI